MSIRFNYADKKLPSSISKLALKKMVATIFKKEKVKLGYVVYIFCSDEYLLQINKSMLQHDYYTDIITFPLQENGKPIESEIYISIDRVKENATNLCINFKIELARVLAHGALHLCGYDDKSKKDIAKMRLKEDEYNSFIDVK